MSNLTTKVKLTTGSRCRSCESDKAYAIKWRNEIFFVPISKSTMIELPNSDSSYKWELEKRKFKTYCSTIKRRRK